MYHRYSSPRDLISMYVDEGRFGELVSDVFRAETRRQREQAQRQNDQRLWDLFLRSGTDKSFVDWKQDLMHKHGDARTGDAHTTAEDAERIMETLFG